MSDRRLIERTLKSSGLSCEIVPGKKHLRVLIDGRQVGVFSRGTSRDGPKGILNLIGHIRRAARGQTQ